MLKRTLAALAMLATLGPAAGGRYAARADECPNGECDGHAGKVRISDKHLPIAVTPICPTPIKYQRYWPTYWYGQPIPRGADLGYVPPMIYQPTDTTQMGMYYQRVPHWDAKYHMLPPPPDPLVWMAFSCSKGGAGCRGAVVPAGTPIQPQPENSQPPAPQVVGNVFGGPVR